MTGEEIRTPCVKCGTILHTGEGRVTVSFTVAELLNLAGGIVDRRLTSRLLCAASLINQSAVDEWLNEGDPGEDEQIEAKEAKDADRSKLCHGCDYSGHSWCPHLVDAKP